MYFHNHSHKKGVSEMDSTEKCPSCGEDMEPGFLVSQRTISWCNHVPKVICYCGEPLSKGHTLCAWVSGHRCKSCKIILYHEVEQSPENDTDDWPAGWIGLKEEMAPPVVYLISTEEYASPSSQSFGNFLEDMLHCLLQRNSRIAPSSMNRFSSFWIDCSSQRPR